MSQQDLVEIQEFEEAGEFSGYNNTGYQGGFPTRVEDRIRRIVLGQTPILHLFSGSSLIGDVRVDLKHSNATTHEDVYQFIENDNRQWRFLVLDPDYHISKKHLKLSSHAKTDSVSGNVLAHRLLEHYAKLHCQNVLYFDMCAPRWKGFYIHKRYWYILGGYLPVRVLTWMKREGERLDTISGEVV